MGTTYRTTVLTGAGGIERLEVQDLPLPEPGVGEVRVRVRACGVGSTDVGMMRRGSYPFAPKVPFTPGYDIIGDVEAVGLGVRFPPAGQRVAALTVHGGFGEVVVRPAHQFVPVPSDLDDAAAAALVLNYVSAFQMVTRVARARPGQTALVTGANGGVGTALLELLRLRGVHAIGAASAAKRALVESFGADFVPSRDGSIDAAVKRIVPEGVDFAFDAIGGPCTAQCMRATRRGGMVVGYGWMGTSPNGKQSAALVLRTIVTLLAGCRLAGRRGALYGITGAYRADPRPFREDLSTLFGMLHRGEIRPLIAARLPLLEAKRAIAYLEAGGIEGKIVLLAGPA